MNKLNKHNKLNEGSPAMGDETKVQDNHSDAFVNAMHDVFIQNKKRENIAVNISMPSTFNRNIRFPVAPMDLRNLLKPEKFADKFVNGHGMMADPVSTFNAAKDIAKQCFEHANTFKKALDKQKEAKFGDVKGKLDRKTNESLDYSLNEDLENAVNIGTTVGDKTTEFGLNILGFGAGLAASVAKLGTLCYATGYGVERMASHVKGTNHFLGTTNTADVVNSNEKTEQAESDASWQGDNVIEAVDAYLRDLADAIDGLLAFINPEAKSDIVNTINDYIIKDTNLLENYIHENSGLIKQMRQEEDERRKKNYEKINSRNREQADFAELMRKVHIDDAADIKMFQKIMDVYNRYSNSSDDKKRKVALDLESAAGEGSWKALMKVVSEKPEYFKVDDSIQYNYSNILNEAADPEQKDSNKPSIDGDTLYNDYITKFKELAREAWPKNLKVQGIDQCKANMDKLKAGCDKEIKDKIQIVCRTTNDGTATTTSDKIKAFFSKHPLQSKYLENLWERHATELNIREENRLKQMQDFSDQTRVTGWLAYIFKNTMPEVLARILTYRHVLMLLKQEGIYTYTPEMFKEDEQIWDAHKEELLADINLMVLMYFVTMGQYWTITGNSFVIPQEGGGYSIDPKNAPSYLSFLLMNCTKGTAAIENGMVSIAPVARQFSDCITKGELDADAFVKNFIGIISKTPIAPKIMNGLGGENDVLNKFKDTSLLDKVKDIINSTYETLNGGESVANIKNNEASYANYILQRKGEKFFSTVIKNFDTLKDKENELANAKDEKAKAKIKKEIESIIGKTDEVNGKKVNIAKIKIIDFENNCKKVPETDRWAYIYQIFSSLKINTVAKKLGSGNSEESIKGICAATKAYMQILSSGILSIGTNISEESIKLKSLQDEYKNLEDGEKEDLDKFAELVYPTNNIPEYNTAVKDLTDENIDKICEIIRQQIEKTDTSVLEFAKNNNMENPALSALDPKTNGVEGATKIGDLFTKDAVKITDISLFDNTIAPALVTIIKYALEKGIEYTKETMQKVINDNDVITIIRSLSDNYTEANKQLEELDPNDPMRVTWQDLFAKMQEQFIAGFNNIYKDFSLAIDTNIWDLLGKIRQHTDANQICGNIANFNFGGKLLSEQEDKKYEIGTALMKYISDKNGLLENEAWKQFYDETK